MNNYPDDLDDEEIEKLAENFPDTANDLKLWKRCNEIGKMFDLATKLGREEYEKLTAIQSLYNVTIEPFNITPKKEEND